MKVEAVYSDPKVIIAGEDDPLALDLVAHFLGIAHHHNDNAAPAPTTPLEVVSGAEGA